MAHTLSGLTDGRTSRPKPKRKAIAHHVDQHARGNAIESAKVRALVLASNLRGRSHGSGRRRSKTVNVYHAMLCRAQPVIILAAPLVVTTATRRFFAMGTREAARAVARNKK